MYSTEIPPEAHHVIVQSAQPDAPSTARRLRLFYMLWLERYLTRAHLIVRTEAYLGKGCFGHTGWENTFRGDMRVVRRAFAAVGHQLKYQRNRSQPGYFIPGQPAIAPELSAVIAGSIAELDPAQLAILKTLTPAQRLQQGISISNLARNVVAHRIHERNPGMSHDEALRLALRENINP